MIRVTKYRKKTKYLNNKNNKKYEKSYKLLKNKEDIQSENHIPLI